MFHKKIISGIFGLILRELKLAGRPDGKIVSHQKPP